MNNLNRDEKVELLGSLKGKFCAVKLVPFEGESPTLTGYIGNGLVNTATHEISIELLNKGKYTLAIPIDKIIQISEVDEE